MFQQIVFKSLNGFTLSDLSFLVFQMSVSIILSFCIRFYWKKGEVNESEKWMLYYLGPLQLALTGLAIFSNQSPWITVLFGLLSMFPLLGNSILSIRSRIFYLLCVFIAYGCGGANLAVTTLVILVFVLPILHFSSLKK